MAYTVGALVKDYDVLTSVPDCTVEASVNDCRIGVSTNNYAISATIPTLRVNIEASEVTSDSGSEESLIPVMCGPIMMYVYVYA